MGPIVLFDSDDVTVDFLGMWVDKVNQEYGTDICTDQVKNWNIMRCFPSLTKEQVFGVLEDTRIWHRLNPMPDSQRYLSMLYEEGYELYLATATSLATCEHKRQRLKYLFPFLDDNHIIISHNKQMIRGDVLIDDGPHNLVGGEYFKILFERPHNLSFPNEKYDMHRVKEWSEVYQLIHNNFPIQI